MSQSPGTSCANCGRPLPAENTVCAFCERELSTKPTSGRYRCPKCGCRFERPLATPWPPNARWYQPQPLKPQCPYCQDFLHDRKSLPVTWVDWVPAVGLVAAVNVFHLKAIVAYGALLMLAAIRLWRWRQVSLSVRNEEDRYSIEENVP